MKHDYIEEFCNPYNSLYVNVQKPASSMMSDIIYLRNWCDFGIILVLKIGLNPKGQLWSNVLHRSSNYFLDLQLDNQQDANIMPALLRHYWKPKLSWCQLLCNWWHQKLSGWQPPMSLMMRTLASWQFSFFQRCQPWLESCLPLVF